MSKIKYQIVLNHQWEWASPEKRIWHYSPVSSYEDAESQAQSMLLAGTVSDKLIGIACCVQWH